jgi:hypothetical protein
MRKESLEKPGKLHQLGDSIVIVVDRWVDEAARHAGGRGFESRGYLIGTSSAFRRLSPDRYTQSFGVETL